MLRGESLSILKKFFFSSHTVVFISLLISFLSRFDGYDNTIGKYIEFQQSIIAVLIAGVLSLALAAFGSFDIESKRQFVFDIAFDVFCLILSIWLLSYLTTLYIYNIDVSHKAFYMAFIALGLSILDFFVSLNAGAGKLLEMDREHLTRDRNY